MKVVFLDTVHSILEERLRSAGFSCIDATSECRENCLQLIADADGLVIRSRFPMDAEFLMHASQLKFIARSGAGMENIDEEYAAQRGITLYNAPEGNRNAVGEHALGMLLALFNKLHTADRDVRLGKWEREHNRGVELDGKTIALIGFGNNGQAFAQKLRGFDVHVIAYDKYLSNFETDQVEEVDMNSIFERADVLSFHIPQTDETRFMANDSYINSFKKNIYTVNLSRGKIIQTSALVSALKSGKVLGACLDVLEYEKTSFESFFEEELSSDFNYLLKAENVILSPHVGGWTHESYFKLSDVLADKILTEWRI